MEIKVNDYVRTDKGEIGKLEDLKLEYTRGKRLVTYYTYREVKENLVVFDNKNITQRFVDGSSIYLTDDELKNVKESIIKTSPNIIDLIEKKDIIKYHFNGSDYISEVFEYKNDLWVQNEDNIFEISEINIKSIVTKKQFEQMEYKIN